MKKNRFVILAVVFYTLFLITSCNKRGLPPIQNINNATIIKRNLTEAQVKKVIFIAGASHGWVFEELGPRELKASVSVKNLRATVKITYTSHSYSVQYVSSENLRADPQAQTIHNRYNGWIRNLEKSINMELARL